MTQKEFSKLVKELRKEIDESTLLVLKGKRNFEEHDKVRSKWKDLCKFAKDNNLYMQ